MSLGIILQFIGGFLGVIGIIVGLYGSYITPQGENIFNFNQKITVNQPRELYSSVQSVIYPDPEGKRLSLDLDGLGLIHVSGEATSSSIAMVTNVVPQTSEGVRVPGQFETRSVRILEGVEGSKKYYFDTNQRQAVEFIVGDKKIMVKLLEIKTVAKEDAKTGSREESFMREYVFQIKEIE